MGTTPHMKAARRAPHSARPERKGQIRQDQVVSSTPYARAQVPQDLKASIYLERERQLKHQIIKLIEGPNRNALEAKKLSEMYDRFGEKVRPQVMHRPGTTSSKRSLESPLASSSRSRSSIRLCES